MVDASRRRMPGLEDDGYEILDLIESSVFFSIVVTDAPDDSQATYPSGGSAQSDS